MAAGGPENRQGPEAAAQAQLRAAYARALDVLRIGRPEAAERQLRQIQQAAPGEINSLRLLGLALLAQEKPIAAIESFEQVLKSAPGFTQARVDLARACRQAKRLEAAREEVRRAIKEAPALDYAWRVYGDVLCDLGKYPDARFAFEQARTLDPHFARIEAATAALVAEDRRVAEEIFRDILKADASHVAALCGLAAVALTAGNTVDAERLLRHASKQTAYSPLVQRALAHTLLAASRLPEAETAILELLKLEPDNPQNWVALGIVHTRLLRQDKALEAYEEAARLNPTQVGLRHSIGHVNKTLGRREECEQAYLQCLRMDPTFGEAYWSLADLKTYRFSDVQVEAMRALLAHKEPRAAARAEPAVSTQEQATTPQRATTDINTHAQIHFALARALEQRQEYAPAFTHYAAGNELRRRTSPFNIEKFEDKTGRVIRCFDRGFLKDKGGSGCQDPAPIFIVGLPRSGSTLIEQILASHSQVEGTMELPNILTQVREFDHRDRKGDGYPESVRNVSANELAMLGQRYLTETRPIRAGRARFTDKMPNNFSHIGLIHLILPSATIVDVRRHPLDACFSTFKQYFAEGQSFSYDLDHLGRYYRCYLALMDHWDAVLPRKVLHVQYEDLIREPQTSIRSLLEHCGLSFEPACLRFHETARPVRTASAEQVRQPLYASGVGHWKHFARELAPLRASLGDCLERFAHLE